MKGSDLKVFISIIIISIFLGYFKFDKYYDSYSDIVTFLSIMIGFQITSLSILFNSPLKKTLSSRKIKWYKTELHRLRDYYSHSLFFNMFSVIILFIFPEKVISFTIGSIIIELGKYLLIIPILFGSLFCFYKITNDLLKIFVHPTNEH